MKKITSLLFFIVATLHSFSQNEYSKWYFGDHAALDFMSSSPTVLNNSAMYSMDGCSSIADASGNLLFYTNGVTVWNKQHSIMANGTMTYAIAYGYYSPPNTMIVKQPGNANLYYIFTTFPAPDPSIPTPMPVPPPIYGFYYSVVDMSLAGGMGSVTVNNTLLYNPPYSFTTEQLHATKHANGTDYWIMVHQHNSLANNFNATNNFVAYLLTSTGISFFSPVVSSIGLLYGNSSYGYLKFSPTGQKLCISVKYVGVELYDFNNNTGMVSNPVTLLSSLSEPNYRGCEFSPDGTKLYAGHSIAGSTDKLIQWDLSAGSNTAIVSSSVNIPSSSLNPAALQLAPNGKIYIASSGSQSLSVINNPNAAGNACNFVMDGQAISAAINSTLNSSSALGLPNMITYTVNTPCITQTVSNPQSICAGSFYAISNHTYTTAGSYTDTIQNVLGCNGIVIVNTQLTVKPTYTVNNPQSICSGNSYTIGSSTYTASGTYTDTLQSVLGCDSVIITQLTVNNLPNINVSGNSTICVNETAALTASGANSYTWSTFSIYQTGASISITPVATTNYTVQGTDENGCKKSIQILVSVLPCTGIEKIKSVNDELRIYPNPAREMLNVELEIRNEELEIKVVDVLGKEIINDELKIKNGKGEVDVSSLQNGVYMICFTDNNKRRTITKKLLIAR